MGPPMWYAQERFRAQADGFVLQAQHVNLRTIGQPRWGRIESTSLQSAIKASFSIAVICAASRRIPASASTNQGPGKGDLILL